ncbi:outer membrane lipoprotein chaperone LolA [Arenimonas sp.]|uniref:outer membrane lipoprotein chaperone LolA n=1 Tax=Arenimonas sp. TaxID=1872635 RepID=UPI0039E4C1FF
MKTSLRSLVLFSLVLAAPVMAGGREQLAAFTRDLRGLDASFEQRVFDPNGRQTDATKGNVKLSAPRLFRWEVQSPAKQLIVADGDHIWIYDPDLEQVTVRNQSFEEQGSPLTVLIDPTELERQFVAREGGKEGGLDWLTLTPKKTEDAPFQQAKLGFGPKGLVRMEFSDSLGQRTVIGFSNWARNPSFAKDTFRFTPPKGADVVGEVSPAAKVVPLRD